MGDGIGGSIIVFLSNNAFDLKTTPCEKIVQFAQNEHHNQESHKILPRNTLQPDMYEYFQGQKFFSQFLTF